MALKIWLPLLGDLKNQGLSDVTVTNNGATVDDDGKLGKCYSFDGSSKYIILTNPLTESSEVSCAVWVKPSTNTSANEQIMNIGTASGWANIRFGILQRSVNQFIFHVSNGTNTITYNCASDTIALDEWVHIVCTYKENTLKMYLNGSLVKTYSISFVPSFSGVSKIGLGAAPNGAEKFTGYICDFRIYDHCLSAKEVKQISQGLVLHYTLSGIGAENLLSNDKLNWGAYTCSSGKYNATSSRFAPYKITIPISPSTNYICHVTDHLNIGQDFYVGVHQLDSSETFLHDSGWRPVPYSFASRADAAYVRLVFRDTLNNAVNIQNYINAIGSKLLIKFEESDRPTPWLPNPSDPQYSIMGLDDGIEYDCSGFGNNGERSPLVTINIDSPRYTSSYGISDNSYFVNCGKVSNILTQGTPEYTVNLWCYKDDWTDNASELVSCTETGGFALDTTVNGLREWSHVYTNAEKTSYTYVSFAQTYALSSGWHMFTLVDDLTGVKGYIDGQLIRSVNSTNYGLHLNANANLYIGAESTGSSYTSPYLNGRVSDFRIYATALSSADVLSLYNLGGSLDSNGTFHTYEYVEV